MDKIHSEISSFTHFLLFILIIITGTAIINFVNFMDGIDGLVSGSLIIIFLIGSILINNYFLIVVGPLLGFLLWNWDPSKLFMGDVGSTFLGALLVGLLLTDSKNINNTYS